MNKIETQYKKVNWIDVSKGIQCDYPTTNWPERKITVFIIEYDTPQYGFIIGEGTPDDHIITEVSMSNTTALIDQIRAFQSDLRKWRKVNWS